MFLYPCDFEDTPMKKSDWLYIIGFILLIIGFVMIFAGISSLSKPQVYKMITPYGNSYYEGEENRPYLHYDARFNKGDTEIFIVNRQAYKIVKVR